MFVLISSEFYLTGDSANGVGKAKKKFVHPKKTAEQRKSDKEKRQLRKARVILRNLPFKVTEDELNAQFSKYGPIKECNILKRADGKLVGCAFIQFEKVNHAAKAIHHGNGKEIRGRAVIIDWAVNRKTFVQHERQQKKANAQVKKEEGAEEMEIKQEDEDEDGDNDEDSQDGSDESDDGNNQDEDEGSDNESVEDEKKPIHQKSNDVAEGCTVFIKNIPFECTNDDLYKVCRQFGPLYYAVITVDKVSGHSKGNGFAKFRVSSSTQNTKLITFHSLLYATFNFYFSLDQGIG